ncbi:MAG: carbamoyl-phosphate synthase small chain [Gemmatimonadota bacterium]|nr:MAG: carbamoyl-phosphate synthase small chain [Gemmatimonadota bacterium]
MSAARAVLALEDGTVWEGTTYGAEGLAGGEVVFHTSMTGYQEILTDPSYHGQLVAMTAPQIGNTGVNEQDDESGRPHVRGFIAREFSRRVSNYRATRSLHEYMGHHGIVGIHDIDTRALTRHLREAGCQRGVLVSGRELGGMDTAALVSAAAAVPRMLDLDPVREVTTARRYEFRGDSGADEWQPAVRGIGQGPTLAVVDCGTKRNILRSFRGHGARVLVFPADAGAEALREAAPDGLLLTNGPGDPTTTAYVVDTIRELLGQLPMLGICLGHQLLALALGATTYKLPFGHHGANHPVQNLATGRIEITSQNHNYAVDAESAEAAGFEITHRSLFDGTVQGMRHRKLGLYSVQYHPEAAPGPHDSAYLWDEFLDLVGGRIA